MLQTAHDTAASSARARVIAELAAKVRARANAAGGWAYYPDKSSRIEPTCWALNALPDLDAADLQRHRAFLERCRRPDGLFVDQPAPANYSHNAMALLALLQQPALDGHASAQAVYFTARSF